jgi:dihydrofolate reductase
MLIKTHHSLSLDGFSATADGWPAITQVTEFAPKKSHGIPEFTATCGAVAMGRTTFLPAIGNPWWPWPERTVYVLTSSELPDGTPDDVVQVSGGPEALLERLRADSANGVFDRDAEVLGGPSLIRAFWQRGLIDEFGLVLLPVLLGTGLPLFPLDDGAAQTPLRLTRRVDQPDGSLELCYERA